MRKLFKRCMRAVLGFILFWVAIIVLFNVTFRVIFVDGESMTPTLQNGDWIAACRLVKAERGDIILTDTRNSYHARLIKRLIAVEGDTVDIDFDTGIVTVNGEALDEVPDVTGAKFALFALDGTDIKAGMDYFPLLDGKIGKPIRLTIRTKGGSTFDVNTKGMSMGKMNELLYKRWVERNRHLVDSLSGGRLAYVHVKAMNSESFRTVYRELLSDNNRNREAVIVDERHNGGGWLHDDLCTLLNGKEYQQFMPRGQFIGRDPFNKWTKPSCVLICEDDYSNGHGFPMVYKTLGIGKLIGAPVAGTMTAVWWETMIDRSLVYGIPQVGCMSLDGTYAENTQLNPDITVYNTPEDFINGNDRQLKAAVDEMLKQIGEKK